MDRLYAATLTRKGSKPRAPGHEPASPGQPKCRFTEKVMVEGKLVPRQTCTSPARYALGATHCWGHKWQEAVNADNHPANRVNEAFDRVQARGKKKTKSFARELENYFGGRQLTTCHKIDKSKARDVYTTGPDMSKHFK